MLDGQFLEGRAKKRSDAYLSKILWQLNLFLLGPTMRVMNSELAITLQRWISIELDQGVNVDLQLTDLAPLFLAFKDPSAAFYTKLVIVMELSVTEFAFTGVFVKVIFRTGRIFWLHLSS
jgi:hypothetical protein